MQGLGDELKRLDQEELLCNGQTVVEVMRRLREPFRRSELEWRQGSSGKGAKGLWSQALAYLTAPAVMERLDRVCGPYWQNRHEVQGDATMCSIGILFYTRNRAGVLPGSGWIWRADGSSRSDMEAVKGGISGSLKRAARQWGIGRYLYDFGTNWIPQSFLEERPGKDGKARAVARGDWQKTMAIPALYLHPDDMDEDRGRAQLPEPGPAPAQPSPKSAKWSPGNKAPAWLGDKLDGKKWPAADYGWLTLGVPGGERAEYLEFHATQGTDPTKRRRCRVVLTFICTGRWILEDAVDEIDVVAELKKAGKL